jgi:hypothetical protein
MKNKRRGEKKIFPNKSEERIPYDLVLENHIQTHKWFHNHLSFWGYKRKRNHIEKKDPGEKEIKKIKKRKYIKINRILKIELKQRW